ncbi:MAG: hypothetical protein WBV28_04965 [Terracidiphilus sp.]
MHSFRSSGRAFCALPLLSCLVLLATACQNATAQAPDIPIGVTYVCNGEHIYIENCNIRDLSDTANCMVAHPDHLTPSGMNSYTYASRGALKKLLPTCQQPSAKQMAAAKAFQQKQQDLYNANVQKANNQLDQNMRANAQADAARGKRSPPARCSRPKHQKSARCAAVSAPAVSPQAAPATPSSARLARC